MERQREELTFSQWRNDVLLHHRCKEMPTNLDKIMCLQMLMISISSLYLLSTDDATLLYRCTSARGWNHFSSDLREGRTRTNMCVDRQLNHFSEGVVDV